MSEHDAIRFAKVAIAQAGIGTEVTEDVTVQFVSAVETYRILGVTDTDQDEWYVSFGLRLDFNVISHHQID
jgi:hypothetical protein